MRHIILISGKDSLATAIVQIAHKPNLPYELVHNEVGWDLPETLEWITRVGEYFKMPIIKCGDDLTAIVDEQNCLPLPWRRFCTRLAKIKPLNDFIGTSSAMVYFGLRADEPDRIGYVVPPTQKLFPKYPLREFGFKINDVWKLCASINLLPPSFHWPWMENRVREKLLFGMGIGSDALDIVPEWERRSLLAWRSRSNCDRCFYARLYERIGLFEFYPQRYEEACVMEETYCYKKDEFTWNRGYRLRDLIQRAQQIKERRAANIVKFLHSGYGRDLDIGENATDDLMATSCGLLCGK